MKNIRIKNNKGLTLIEVLVGMLIIGIIIAAFSGIFINSFKGIILSGNRSKLDYSLQKVMENKINSIDVVVTNTSTTQTSGNLSITYGTYTIDVSGISVNITFDDGKQNETFISFIPD